MSKLYLVPTPIGNLEDMTFRAIRILKEVDLILAEDTRTSGKLLKHFEISTHMHSHHMHNEHKTIENVISRLKAGENIALISDAGTPAISDPGFLLTRACVEHKIEVECLPGATAFVPALVNSGLPNDKFVFEGFLPEKKGRQTRYLALAEETRTMILYVSPHKLVKTLAEFITYFGEERPICVSRELSKLHEENVRGTAREVLTHFEKTAPRGEIVVVVGGKTIIKENKNNLNNKMSIHSFLQKLKQTPNAITFPETIAVIEEHYDFTPTAFQNGLQHNSVGENSGSCKLFAFAKLQHLSQEETLACFGAFYYDEVLKSPEGTNHQNIRNFMKTGWNGIQFEGEALTLKA